jgi:putative membrane protein
MRGTKTLLMGYFPQAKEKSMRNTLMLGSVAILSLALSACDQNTTASAPAPSQTTQTASREPAPGSRNETVSATKDAVASAVGTLSAELTTTMKGFVEGAAMGDMYEVEASKIAVQRARSKDVKDFAQMMIDAHSKTTADLKTALAHGTLTVALPVHFDSRHEGLINDLKGAKAEDFDGRYLSQQTGAHDEAVVLMRGYAKDGDNPDLKAFATNTMPKVRMHMDMVKMLNEQLSARQKRAENRP